MPQKISHSATWKERKTLQASNDAWTDLQLERVNHHHLKNFVGGKEVLQGMVELQHGVTQQDRNVAMQW
jgi:hypothetical protein